MSAVKEKTATERVEDAVRNMEHAADEVRWMADEVLSAVKAMNDGPDGAEEGEVSKLVRAVITMHDAEHPDPLKWCPRDVCRLARELDQRPTP